MHFSGEEQREVDHAAPAKGRVAGRKGAEAIVEQVCPRTDSPRGESVNGVGRVILWRDATSEQIRTRSPDRNLQNEMISPAQTRKVKPTRTHLDDIRQRNRQP